MKFLDVKTDFAFKKSIWQRGIKKNIVMSFLNAIIEFDKQRKITDLTIVDPYSIPMLSA